MIHNFKHKGLKKFFLKNDVSKLNPEHITRIGDILFLLNSAKNIQKINAPGLRLHQLKGDLEGYWSVTVTANYRIIFRFNEEKQEVYDVDYIDYHGK
ncbi:MAG: type II toxin-antitoxin system RelE/ParE family toxin [Vampirovibrionia bacterium]